MRSVRLRPDQRLREANDGEFLLGGSPSTLLRLTEAGTARVSQWFDGAPLAQDDLKLARRLAKNGMAHVELITQDDLGPEATQQPAPYVVVVPVYNDLAGLQATLSLLDGCQVVVVDDGSTVPIEPDELGPTVELLRPEGPSGPAAARNIGLRHVETTHDGPVAFVDAGVEIAVATLDALVRQLFDPVADPMFAAAPRVRSTPGPGAIAAYERLYSPLDLGPVGGHVGPERPLSYVPSACLVMSRAGIEAGRLENGDLFDPHLRFGEDVDLVWRIATKGTVRYIPELEALHRPRRTLAELIKQRIGYGSAAGPLGRQHGSVITPFRTSRWGVVVALAIFSGHPAVAITACLASAEAVRRQLPDDLDDRTQHAFRLVGTSHTHTVKALAAAAMRPWWPLTLVLGSRAPHAALRLLGVAAVRRFVGSRHEMVAMTRPANVGLGLVDDVAYGIGVLRGCMDAATVRPLVPVVSS